jgi:hypothetical protein
MLAATAHAFRRTALPLACYYGVTLGLPLMNGAAMAGAAFLEHALVVLVVPPALIVVVCAMHEVARRLVHRPRGSMRRDSILHLNSSLTGRRASE